MIERTIEKKIRKISSQFKVVLVTGARQVGKTTLLKSMAEKNRGYVTLDDLNERELAKNDPKLFLENHPAPVIIDEIQYAPNLLSYIKIAVDNTDETGLYWLTGSQQFQLMKGVTESLAGRIGIVEMSSLSLAEKLGRNSFAFNPEDIKDQEELSPRQLFNEIFRGGMPQLIATDIDRETYFSNYIRSYIERDVRDLTQVGDLLAFQKFMISVAARTGETLNIHNIAEDAGIDERTVEKWLSILVANNIVYLLQPYLSSELQRATKTPKIIFLDTGLCAYLCKWSSPETLEASSVSGHFLESFIISEIIKNKNNSLEAANYDIFFYRDRDGKEIDLVLFMNGTLYPFEIKKSANPQISMTSNFSALKSNRLKIGDGGIICFYPHKLKIAENISAIPISSVI